MARWRPLLLACAAVLTAAAPARADAPLDATVARGVDAGHSGFLGGGSLGRPPLAERWRMPLHDAGPPIVADGRVFTLGREVEDGPVLLQARSAADGAPVWSRSVADGGALAYGDGTIVMQTTGGLAMAVDAASGRTRWSRQLTVPFGLTAPVVADGAVYTSSTWSSGFLIALDLGTGAVRWQQRVDDETEPAFAGRQVLVARGCSGYALTPSTGETRFDRDMPCGYGYEANLAATDGGVLVGALGGVADTADGRVIDQVPGESWAGDDRSLAGDLLVVADGNRLVARSLSRQVDVWSLAVPDRVGGPLVVDGVVYQGSRDGVLRAVDLATGRVLWTGALGTGDVGSPRMAAGAGRLLVRVGDELVALASALPSPASGLRITSGPSGPAHIDSATFGVTPAPAGLVHTCALDAGPPAPCPTGATYSGLGEGPHTVTVRAVDAGGVVRGIAARGFSVDRTAPVARFHDDDWASPTRDPLREVAAASEEGSAVQCRVDGGAWAACNRPVAMPELRDGRHVLEARGLDAQGNVQSPPTRRELVVDRTGPDVEVQREPPWTTRSRDATIEFTTGSDTMRTTCIVEGVWDYACKSPIRLEGLPEGFHQVAIRPMDDLGNETFRYVQWRVDRTPPEWKLTTAPPERTNAERVTVAVDGDVDATYECRVDDDEWAGCDADHGWLTQPLEPGERLLQIRATDSAGNVQEDPPVLHVVIDRTPPTLRVTERPPARSTSRTVRASFDSEAGARFTCSVGGVTGPCTSPWRSDPLEDGVHTLRITATDRAGNMTLDETTFTVAAGDDPGDAGASGGPGGGTGGGSTAPGGTGGATSGSGAGGNGGTGSGGAGGSTPSGGGASSGGAPGDGAGTGDVKGTSDSGDGVPRGTVAVTRRAATTPSRAAAALTAWLRARSAAAVTRAGTLALPVGGRPGTLRVRLRAGGRLAARGALRRAGEMAQWLRLVPTAAGARLLRRTRTLRVEVELRRPDGRVVRAVRTVRLRAAPGRG